MEVYSPPSCCCFLRWELARSAEWLTTQPCNKQGCLSRLKSVHSVSGFLLCQLLWTFIVGFSCIILTCWYLGSVQPCGWATCPSLCWLSGSLCQQGKNSNPDALFSVSFFTASQCAFRHAGRCSSYTVSCLCNGFFLARCQTTSTTLIDLLEQQSLIYRWVKHPFISPLHRKTRVVHDQAACRAGR